MISCENCSYYNTFTIVTEKHYPICRLSPVNCPNYLCPIAGLRRYQLEQHLNECNHKLMDCPNTGYSVRLLRGDMKLHTLQQHGLVLEQTKQAIAITPATVSPQYLYNQAPMEFVISNFYVMKKEWFSSPFYTHNRGYNFCLVVHSTSDSRSNCSYVSVYAALMRGEYDEELEWPFEGDIRVEIVNWKEDKNHYAKTIAFNRYYDLDGKITSRVTCIITDQDTETGTGFFQFISHTALAPTATTNYLLVDHAY